MTDNDQAIEQLKLYKEAEIRAMARWRLENPSAQVPNTDELMLWLIRKCNTYSIKHTECMIYAARWLHDEGSKNTDPKVSKEIKGLANKMSYLRLPQQI